VFFLVKYLSKVLHLGITDHSLLFLDLEFSAKYNACDTEPAKTLIDYNRLFRSLSSIDWDPVYSKGTVSSAFDMFLIILNKCLDECRFQLTHSSKTTKRNPWMTSNLLRRVQRRKKLFELTVRHPGNIALKNYYVRFSNKLKVDLASARELYYSSKFNECNGNSRAQWNIINSFIGKKIRNLVLQRLRSTVIFYINPMKLPLRSTIIF
jgi:hypothetical protein